MNYYELISKAFVIVAEALIVHTYCSNLFSIKPSVPRTAFTYFVGYAVVLAAAVFINVPAINVLLYFSVNLLILKYNYNCGNASCSFHSAVLCATMCLTEVISSLILGVFSEEYYPYEHSSIVLFELAVLSKLMYIIICIIGAKMFAKHNVGTSDNYTMLKLCALPIASSAIALTMLYASVSVEMKEELLLLIVCGLVILFFANIYILSVYRSIEEVSQDNLSMRLAILKDEADAGYYRMLDEQYQRERILIHDIKNHIQAIDGLASEGRYDELKSYVNDWSHDDGFQRQVRFCDNSVLNIVICRYERDCEENGIDFYCDIRDKSVDFIDNVDISSMFGNLLSNAYEAAVDSEEKSIEFEIISKPTQKTTVIRLSNSCSEAPEKGENGNYASRKKDKENHGIGQKSIKRLVGKYNGSITSSYNEREHKFETLIIFPR